MWIMGKKQAKLQKRGSLCFTKGEKIPFFANKQGFSKKKKNEDKNPCLLFWIKNPCFVPFQPEIGVPLGVTLVGVRWGSTPHLLRSNDCSFVWRRQHR